MACIVYYTDSKTGAVSAYRSEAVWNSEKGYSVPKRTYLGRVDPETHEIIPTSHKRGRPTKDHASSDSSSQSSEFQAKYEAACRELQELKQTVNELKQKNKAVEKTNSVLLRTLKDMHQQLGTLITLE